MRTFLFAWNPKKWDWVGLEQSIKDLEETGNTKEPWSCASHKSISVGDRAFLVKLGKMPTGIMASGFVVTKPVLAKHWSDENKMVPRVIIDFEFLLNPQREPILSLDLLKKGKLSDQNWTPQQSGISIRPGVVDDLEELWFNFVARNNNLLSSFIPEEAEAQEKYVEGAPYQIMLTRYERNLYARKKCIEYHKPLCVVCKINFEKTYGPVGKDFIHIHHLQPISTIEKPYEVDPIKDLCPVCPNCHSIIHKRKPAFTIQEMIEIMRLNSREPRP